MKAHQTLLAKHSFVLRFTSLLAVFISCLLNVHAQDSQRTRGFYPGASYAVSDIDTVNTKNGNLMLSVPTASLPPGRGGLSAGIGLFYDSKIFDTFTYYDGRYLDGPNTTELVASQDGGWRYGFQYEFQLQNRFANYQPQGSCDEEQTYKWKVRMKFPDGSIHVFRPHGYTDGLHDDYFYIRPDGWRSVACQADWLVYTGTMTYYSADGTYLRLDVQHDGDSNPLNNLWTLYLSDGGRVTGGGTSFERIFDRNNNYIEIQNITYNNHPATKLIDQMNRYIILEYGPAGEDYVYAWRNDENGQLTQLTWTIKWRGAGFGNQYYANPNDISIGITFSSPGVSAVDEIVLPAQSGGLIYKFAYNSDSNPAGWGEVSSVTLPSGARTKYQFSMDGGQAPYSAIETKDILIDHPTQKDLVYRPENDLASGVSSTPCNPSTETCITDTWTFSYVGTNSPANAAQTTGPDGGITKDYFQGTLPGMEGNPTFNPVFKSERPDGTMLETLWQLNYPNGCDGNIYGVNPYVKTEFTSIKNAGGNYTKTRIKDYNYDKNGNVTRVAEYDWVDYSTVPHDSNGQVTGIPGGAVVKRVTTNAFYNATPDASNTSYTPYAYNQPSSPQFRKAIQASEVSANGVNALSRTEYFFDNPSTTANLTQQKSWDSTKGAHSNPLITGNSISTSSQYDSFGNVTLSTDAGGTQTTYTFGAVNGFTGLYPTQIVDASNYPSIARTTNKEYDFYSGLVIRDTDADNSVSSATTYDVFGRAILVKAAEGKPEETRTSTEYSDLNRRIIVRSDLNNIGDGKLVKIDHYDQLGRLRLERQLEDSTTQSATSETEGVKTQTRYAFSGSNSYRIVSNPYRAAYSYQAGSEVSMGWARAKADNGGRQIEEQTFGGASLPAPWGSNTVSTGTITTAYDANFTTVADQTGKLRRSMTNALGQLARIDEPDKDTNSLGTTDSPVQPTSYTYEALGNLTQVVQGTQTRTFAYSSLSRLLSATNPESGTFGYQYDNDGNLMQKTDARGIVSTYVYDALNRNTTVNYSDTTSINPDITRIYDTAANGKGRLRESYAGGNETVGANVDHTKILSYDALGRPLDQRQRFKTNSAWSAEYQSQRGYNRAGSVTSQTYPSGRTVSYAYDNAGRANSFTGNLGDSTQRSYSTEITYSALGGMTKEKFGTDTALYNKLFYNSRGQLSEIRESTSYTGPTDTTWNRGAIINHYSNSCWGMCYNLASNTSQSMPDNNGNLKKQEVYVPLNDQLQNAPYTTWWQGYDYDSLNRLQRVHEYTGNTPLDWQQENVYDRYGNRTIHQTNTWSLGINKKDFTVNTANNRLGVPGGQTGVMTYDNAGNLTTDTYTGAGSRTYDAENRMTKAWGGNNQWQEYGYNADGQRTRRKLDAVETWQIYGMDGELLAEYAANGAAALPQKEYGYRNGQLLVTASSDTSSGLVGYWKFDENTGTTAADASGSGNTGTLASGAAWGAGQNGSAVSLDGVNDYVQVGAQSSLVMSNAASFSAWIYPTGAGSEPTYGGVIINKEGEYEIVRFPNGTIQWAFANSNPGWNFINTGYVAPLNQWTHVAVTYDNGTIKTYANGTLVHTYNGAGSIGDVFTALNDFRIGGRQVISQHPQGRIEEVRVYNRVLTATEVSLLPSAGSATANINWLVTDQLGTPRMIFDKTGALATVKRHDYLPFGEELFAGQGGRTTALGYSGDNIRQKFTSKERDNETGLDYFLARYYSSTQGRFTSPDEFTGGPDELYNFAEDAADNPTFYADLTNPQSLNKYQYTYNNPVNMTDEDGHCPICAAVVEVAGTVVDVVTTVRTLRDPNASTAEKVVTVVGTAAGLVLPAGGYALAGKAITKQLVKREAKQVAVKTADDLVDGASATSRGLASEKRVLDKIGETKNTKKVSSPEGNSVPDYQNKTTVGEIKDTKTVSNTRQVRIQRSAAKASGRRHEIQTGTNTRVRPTVKGSKVIRRDDLGPQQ